MMVNLEIFVRNFFKHIDLLARDVWSKVVKLIYNSLEMETQYQMKMKKGEHTLKKEVSIPFRSIVIQLIEDGPQHLRASCISNLYQYTLDVITDFDKRRIYGIDFLEILKSLLSHRQYALHFKSKKFGGVKYLHMQC